MVNFEQVLLLLLHDQSQSKLICKQNVFQNYNVEITQYQPSCALRLI